MKRRVCVAAVTMILGVNVVFAADVSADAGKDRCLLYSENCPEQGDAIMERLARLRKEIARGPSVYSAAETALLEHRLQESLELLETMVAGGGGD